MKRDIEGLLSQSMRRTNATIEIYKGVYHEEEVKQAAYSFAFKKETKLLRFLIEKSHKIEDGDGFYANYLNIVLGNFLVIKNIYEGTIEPYEIANFYSNARQYGYF